MLPVMAKGCKESRQCHQMVSLESYMCSVSSFDAMIGCSNRSGMADTGCLHLHADWCFYFVGVAVWGREDDGMVSEFAHQIRSPSVLKKNSSTTMILSHKLLTELSTLFMVECVALSEWNFAMVGEQICWNLRWQCDMSCFCSTTKGKLMASIQMNSMLQIFWGILRQLLI